MELLGEMIKSVRKDQNLTQEQLGELIGVQKFQTIHPLPQNNTKPFFPSIQAFFRLERSPF